MILTDTTLWRDFEHFDGTLTEESREKVLKAAMQKYAGVTDFYQLKVGAFLDFVDGKVEAVGVKGDATVFEHYYLAELHKFCEGFVELLQKLTLQMEGDELAASGNLIPMSFSESVFVFLRSYFGLPSFVAVQELTLNDWVVAKHDDYNKKLFQRNFNKMQSDKIKKRK